MRSLVYLLPLIALWALAGLSPPVTMIAIATTLFLAIKTHALVIYFGRRTGGQATAGFSDVRIRDLLVWYSVWWGLKPSEFFQRTAAKPLAIPAACMAIAKIVFGAILLTIVAPTLVSENDSLTRQWIGGWIGMVGVVFTMHFGYGHFSALVLRAIGYPIKPIMNFPLLSKTVSEFWGKRWNIAFRDYAHATLFSPLSRRFGVSVGTVAGFIFSGVIHELAISVPAGGGYGWPMLYFVIQAVGTVTERRMHKSGLLSSGSIKNRCWAILVILVPSPLLFHGEFVFEVINPIVGWCDLSGLLN